MGWVKCNERLPTNTEWEKVLVIAEVGSVAKLTYKGISILGKLRPLGYKFQVGDWWEVLEWYETEKA